VLKSKFLLLFFVVSAETAKDAWEIYGDVFRTL